LEAVYQECLAWEFALRELPFEQQVRLDLQYKGHALQQQYSPDFVCFGKILIELKAVSKLTDIHRAQVHNYLKATGYKLGLLVNFGHSPGLEWQRLVY
jgi:GxxExxY protein